LFEASFDKDSRNAAFSTTSQSGTALSGNVYIDDYAAKVHLYLNISYSELGFDSMFSPVLD
jgi:phage terminase large subunit-like protein